MQTELHRHLDVSIRSSTLFQLASDKNLIKKNLTLDAFEKQFFLRKPMADLQAVLSQFTLFQKVMDKFEVLETIAFEAVEDCWREGTRKIEFRYAPGFVSEIHNLNWNDSLLAFHKGISRAQTQYPEMKVGLICIVVRDFGQDAAEKTTEFFLKHFDRFIGIDLAGNEKLFPCNIFKNSFQEARKKNAKITIHAGEAGGPDDIWEALDILGAQRIGHGVASIRDPKLIKYLSDHQICLEMCPTSNWLTQAVSSLNHHPLPHLLRAGVPVCINTDDPGAFGITLNSEIEVCKAQMQLSSKEIELCFKNANQASFLNP